MQVAGTVNLGNISESFTDFGNIISDVLITASNFQLINVKKNNKTLVYGKAFSDMFLLIQGPMNNLTLAGNVALLNGTELTYTLKDGGMAQQEDVSDLVTFTAFTDTLNVDEVEVKHNVHWGVDMSIGVSIGQAVKVAVNLTPDAKSGIDIQGGGELLYTMNMLGDTQFTGRYNINNGTVTPLLVYDTCHPNSVGYAVTGNIIFDRLLEIGAFDEVMNYYDKLNTPSISFENVSYSSQNKTLSVSVLIDEELKSQNGRIIIAVYDDSELIRLQFDSSSHIFENVSSAQSSYTVKVFYWTDTNDIIPLCDSISTIVKTNTVSN
jgi:hypothetical protein